MNFKRALRLQHTKLVNLFRLQGGWSYQPLAVSFTLTGACNLRCAMCDTRSTSGIYLDANLVINTLDEIAARWWWKKPVIHFIGGEPFLHRALPDLVSHAAGHGFSVTLTTNGVLLSEFAGLLLENRVKHLTVSIDGPEELHDTIRGVHGTYQKALAGVRALTHGTKPRPTIALNCTIGPENHHRLMETAQVLEHWGVDSLTFQHLVFDKESLSRAERIDPDRVRIQLSRMKNARFRTPINVFPPIRQADLSPYYRDLRHPFKPTCVVPWLVARVYPGAEVAPCLDMYMGKITERPLLDIWNNEAWRLFRRTRRKGRLLPGCLRCCHRQYYG